MRDGGNAFGRNAVVHEWAAFSGEILGLGGQYAGGSSFSAPRGRLWRVFYFKWPLRNVLAALQLAWARSRAGEAVAAKEQGGKKGGEAGDVSHVKVQEGWRGWLLRKVARVDRNIRRVGKDRVGRGFRIREKQCERVCE